MKTSAAQRAFWAALAPGFLLVAVSCALAAAPPDERTVAAALQASGVEVKFDAGGTAISVFCRESSKLTPEDYQNIGKLRGLKTLTLYGRCSLTDETLASLAGLEELDKVGIDGAKLTDEGLRHMAGWKGLRQLTFFHVLNKEQFTGAGVKHLANLSKLESFGCGGSSFTDEGMQACAALAGLVELRIWHTPATDAGVTHLKKLANLRSLRLAPQFAPRITDAALPQLAEIKSLETLSLGEMRLTWDAGLKHLKALPRLKKLDLDLVDITADDLARLKSELPGVQISHKPPDEKQLETIRRNWDRQRP